MDLSALSTSLPRPQPTSDSLLDEFKNAALSVTTLYKAANKATAAARVAGYQECLADLLGFLESNEGMCDAEGIKRWALERYCVEGEKREDVGLGTVPVPVPVQRESAAMNATAKEEERSTAVAAAAAPATAAGAATTHQPVTSHPIEREMSMDFDSEVSPMSSPAIQQQTHHLSSSPLPSQHQHSQPFSLPRSPAFSFRSDNRLPRHAPPQMTPSRTTAPAAGRKRGIPYEFLEMCQSGSSGKRGRMT